MKILHTVEHYYPSVGGAQEVVRQLSEHLVLMGHDITVATTGLSDRQVSVINGVKIVEFDVSGNAVRGYTGRDIKKYQNFLISSSFDVIMNYAAQQWTTDLAFEVIDKISARKILVPCGYSALDNPDYLSYFKKLPKILRHYDATVYLSHNYRDINFARKHKLKHIYFIPNGADEREFLHYRQNNSLREKFRIKKNDKLILSIGNHTGMKGHAETIKMFLKANISDAVLMILGHHSTGGCAKNCNRSAIVFNTLSQYLLKSKKRIIVTNLPREEVIEAYHSSNLFLFLSHVEYSPLVLFEAAASGLPFIASTAGNSSEIAAWTNSGIAIDLEDETKIIAEIEEILNNTKRLKLMARNGRAAWVKKYTWEHISQQYLKLYEGKSV